MGIDNILWTPILESLEHIFLKVAITQIVPLPWHTAIHANNKSAGGDERMQRANLNSPK